MRRAVGPTLSLAQFTWFAFGILFLWSSALSAVANEDSPVPVREANTTLRLPRERDDSASAQYRTVEVWPGLAFDQPVAITTPPGDHERLFVVERTGRIMVITNLSNPVPSVFLDIRSAVDADWDKGKVEGLSSVAFAPGFVTNRFPFLYLTYTLRLDGPQGPGNYNRLSRFQSTRSTPNQASRDSEIPLITQLDRGDGHNFNSLAFGPDGYLYMAAGDEGDGGTGDDFDNAQRIDHNFFSAILRIDVEGREGSLTPNPHPASSGRYLVPADNPWVGATQFNGLPVDPARVRTEFYAVGLRNPWRMAFDPPTGLLYEGDVGQHAREEINLIVAGGNYGWSFREGRVNGPKGPPPAGVVLIDPIHEYSPGYGPDQGFSVIGGLVYRGPSLPELEGAYIFADYVTGNVWALRHDGIRATEVRHITSRAGIAGFGVDPRDGELLLIDHDRGALLKLERTTPPDMVIPQTLSATGAFSDLDSLTPHAGIVPYNVNVPFWSDGSDKQRWFSLPDLSQTIGFSREGHWSFPAGAVWIKHFELTNAAAGPVRRLETRFLVKTQTGVYGVTYRWGDSLADAVLVPPEGLDEPIAIRDGGVIRTQVWRYPSQSECVACHNPTAGDALGFNTAQLNRAGPVAFANGKNQVQALSDAGYFQTTVSNIHTLPVLVDLSDETASREFRVRSYLAVNCSFCHQPGGSAYGSLDARASTPLWEAGLIDAPLFNSRGDLANRVIAPGAPQHSMLLTRISELGADRMPPIASRELDLQAIDLLRAWITNDLPARQSFPDWQRAVFGSTDAPDAGANADPDGDGAGNQLEFLAGRNPLDPSDFWKIGIQKTNGFVEILFSQPANRWFEVQFTEDISSPAWQPLNVPGNRRFPAASEQVTRLRDATTNSPSGRLYRVTLGEP